MKKFMQQLEEGVETVMWQLNRSAEQVASEDEFAVKASHVTIKMQRKGDLYLQSVLNFNLRGGYLSKAIGRNRAGKCHGIYHASKIQLNNSDVICFQWTKRRSSRCH